MNKQTFPLDKYLLLTLALLIFAIAPLFYPGYFEAHSGYLPLWNIDSLRQNWLNLSWLPPFQTTHFFPGEGLLPYYLAGLIPVAPLTALKMLMTGSLIMAGTGLYLWLKSWLGAEGASVSALVYIYSPFLMTALYIRGSFSEVFFWGLLPWALLAATFLVAQPKLPIMIIGAGFWAIIGLSHLGLSLFALIFMLVMLLVFHRPQALRPIISASAGIIIAALLTLFKLAGQSDIFAPTTDLSQHLLYPAQLIAPFWGFGLSQASWDDGLSLSIGLAAFGLSILSIAIWRGGPDRRPFFFLGVALTVSLLLLPIMGWFWQLPIIGALLTYPWQLLGFAMLGLAVMSGLGFWLEPRLRQWPLYASIVLFILLAMYPNLEPQYITGPVPASAEAIYGQNDIFLLNHAFVVDNPTEGTDINPVEPFIPLVEHGSLSPGDEFYLQVKWQTTNQLDENYKIFTHLVDEAGNIITQLDVSPEDMAQPSSLWQPGQLIEQSFHFTLPAEAPAPAQVWLGFYDAETLERLPANTDSEGRAILDVE